ncbi:MAG: winged helix-turn-helix domain-containing protein [Burkholderiaceae bacterium]
MDAAACFAALLIDDKESLLVVRTALECAGFTCEAGPSARALESRPPRPGLALVVADSDAVDVAPLVAWRDRHGGAAPALLVLGAGDALCAARHLDMGIDDFVARPLRGSELLARAGAALARRARSARGPAAGGCGIDGAARAIVAPGRSVPLTTRELALARLLFERPDDTAAHTRLARDTFGPRPDAEGHPIDHYVHHLRRSLRRCAGDALRLRGTDGGGYRIDIAGSPVPRLTVARESHEALARARRASELARHAIRQAAA